MLSHKQKLFPEFTIDTFVSLWVFIWSLPLLIIMGAFQLFAMLPFITLAIIVPLFIIGMPLAGFFYIIRLFG